LYYYRSSGAALSSLEFAVVYIVVFLRLMCIYFKSGAWLRQFFQSCGFAEAIASQQDWFYRASDMIDTDPFMWSAAVLAGNFVKSVVQGCEETHHKVALGAILCLIVLVEVAVQGARAQFAKKGIIGAGFTSVLKVHRNLGIPLMLVVFAVPFMRNAFAEVGTAILGCIGVLTWLVRRQLAKQRASFKKLSKEYLACSGCCAADCPCPATKPPLLADDADSWLVSADFSSWS
jgi:hypothetical protein